MRKPRALRPGDRVAIVAPASPFDPGQFEAGIAELRTLGFEPVYTETIFERHLYLAGDAERRAHDLEAAWCDPTVAAVIAARGGYGSVQLLPRLDAAVFRRHPKILIGYSDITTLLTWLLQSCGLTAIHGPMIEGRFAHGAAGYDRESFLHAVCRADPPGEITHPELETMKTGTAAGPLVGGTLTQLVASLGTPFAFDPPAGCVLFLDEISERPYRLDRMLMQLRLSGILARVAAIVFNGLPRCVEDGGSPTAREVVHSVLRDFPGPVLYGLPSGHTDGGPMLTLPLGVRARVVAGPAPALVIEESAVAASGSSS
jgi:muramoyltetrapeptide carboxypeptidase